VKIALHICCGVCAGGAVEKLISEGYQVYGFFCNPNIHPQEEYEKRLKAAIKVSRELSFSLTHVPYEPAQWFTEVNGLEDEPEGGRRCHICFKYRLEKTYQFMLARGLKVFTSSLTISPQKPAALINQIGQEIGSNRYLIRDFKKHAGFQRSSELAKEWNIHRQHYCGCIYSLNES